MRSPMRARSVTTACRQLPTASSFAKSKEFCKKAFEAGHALRVLAVLTASATTPTATGKSANLFDVKLRAIENMHEAGIEIVLVVTIVNNVNNDSGRHRREVCDGEPQENRVLSASSRFRLRDATKTLLRNAACANATPFRTWRRTSAHRWARSSRRRDWFSDFRSSARFAGFSDMVKGQESQWGSLSCGLPPQLRSGHGADDQQGKRRNGLPFRASSMPYSLRKTSPTLPTRPAAKNFSNFMMAMALLKNYKPFQGPKGLKLYDLFKKFDKTWALTKGGGEEIWPDFTGPHLPRRHEAPADRSLELPVHRGDVVPRSVQL